MKRFLISLVVVLFVVGCSKTDDTVPDETDQKTDVVSKVNVGDYDLLVPFKTSGARKYHVYRETDIIEIGNRLLEKSKKHFSVNNFKLSEGSLITEDRYLELLKYKTEDNPSGLNTAYPEGIQVEGTTVINPVFVTDLYEVDFHKSGDVDQMDGIAVAMVMGRIYETNPTTGATVRLSDDTLYEIGRSMGLQLSAYLRSLEGMNNTPIYIGIYVQESENDKLPNNYLPGYFIGDSYSEGNNTTFNRNTEKWMLLSTAEAAKTYPEIANKYVLLSSNVQEFLQQENVGVVGKIFTVDNNIEKLTLEINVIAKTFTELYGVGQYVSSQLSTFEGLGVPINVNVMMSNKTRIVIIKQPGREATLTVLQ